MFLYIVIYNSYYDLFSGGRMSTSRSPEDPLNTVDLGAQYITLTKDYQDKRKG